MLPFSLPSFFVPFSQRTITIRLRDHTCEETYFKVRSSTEMEKVFNTYATRKGVQVSALRLCFFGQRLNYDDTADSLELEDQDVIDVKLEQQGGKPVILLYPSAPLDATVVLELSPLWSFSALYPKPPSSKLQQASASEVCTKLLACVFHSKHRRGPTIGRM